MVEKYRDAKQGRLVASQNYHSLKGSPHVVARGTHDEWPQSMTRHGADMSEHRARPQAFWLLWGVESVSLVGTHVTFVVLPLVAVQVLGVSELVMGVLTAAGWLPVVLLGLFVGVFVDRGRPVVIMVVTHAARLVLILLIPLAYVLGSLSVSLLLVVAVMSGVCSLFFDVAYQTFLPHLVSVDRLTVANSRLQASRSVAQMAGPALAGVLVAVLSAPIALLVDVASFAVGLVLMAPLVRGCGVPVESPDARASSVGGYGAQCVLVSVAEGVAFIWGCAPVRAVTCAAAVSNLFWAGVLALQVVVAVDYVGMSAASLGLVLAAEGAAALVAAAAAPAATRWLGEGGVVCVSLCLMAGATALLVVASTFGGVVGFAVAQVLLGLSGPPFTVTSVTMRQRLAPPELLGRVNAAGRAAVMSTLPVGAVSAGVLATWVGVQGTYLVAMVGILCVTVYAYRCRDIMTVTG